MTRLPLVKKEIAYSMKANMETRKASEREAYLMGFWDSLSYEQPDLTKMIFREMEEMEDPAHQGFFLQGVCFIYMSLQSQLEANEFKEKWDMDGDVPF